MRTEIVNRFDGGGIGRRQNPNTALRETSTPTPASTAALPITGRTLRAGVPGHGAGIRRAVPTLGPEQHPCRRFRRWQITLGGR
jgi:hypothetical protein